MGVFQSAFCAIGFNLAEDKRKFILIGGADSFKITDAPVSPLLVPALLQNLQVNQNIDGTGKTALGALPVN
jgi:hypothetical protein